MFCIVDVDAGVWITDNAIEGDGAQSEFQQVPRDLGAEDKG